jgi:glycosyltransferase involved in cell wall biosynthesis
MSSYPKVSVVICALNEEKNLRLVLPKIPNLVDEIIIVDGHSTDRTVEVAKKLRPGVVMLCQPNTGKGEALKYGVASSKGDIIVTLDADGTYSPEEIPLFVQAVLQGYDFAKGTRFLGTKPACMPIRRRVGNRILALTANLLFHTKYTDICSGYYAFLKADFMRMNLISQGFEMEQELFVKIAKMKLKVVEIPHSYTRRMYGASKTHDFRQGITDLLWIISLFPRDDAMKSKVGT